MNSYDRYLSVSSSLPSNVKLIAVSKTKSLEEMEKAYKAGARDFGENKVQELISKYDRFHDDVRWHIIGHLQRNKVKYIVGKVSLIQSLDSILLLNEIEKQFGKRGMMAHTLIEINIGEEESKTGILLKDLDNLLESIEKCSFVKVHGLMSVIPKGSAEENRYYFRKLKKIYEELGKKNIKNVEMNMLSMGMTHDYNIAIEEGSNMVRIGEGIFGKRNYNINN